jgi:HTH-type transcriptional regulator, glycine betaine synthesis regulator
MPQASADTTSQFQAEIEESSSLSGLETEMIDLFVRMAQLAGLPKSIGQIYGLIYASADPLDLEYIVKRLAISKGSASQGLRFLRSTGAVTVVSVAERRSEHYVPETSLRTLVAGFLKEQIEPHLDHGVERLARLRELADQPEFQQNEILTERIQRLESWHNRAISLLPFALRFLGR